MRGDLNTALRAEQRLKDQIQELRTEAKDGDRQEELEKRIRVLTAQNVALRSAIDSQPTSGKPSVFLPPTPFQKVGWRQR